LGDCFSAEGGEQKNAEKQEVNNTKQPVAITKGFQGEVVHENSDLCGDNETTVAANFLPFFSPTNGQ
jgi:hypothetical protein